jgi:peptidoglycan/LPS O-acetylase OafA/YrhL
VTEPAPAAAPERLGHRRWLDGLRGVAILLVLLYHLGVITGGFLGVDVFFVISGFLITTLLAEERQRRGAVSFKRFYLRRALRLLPALYALILVQALYAALFLPPEAMSAYRREALVTAAYVANWVHLHQVPMPTLGCTWSLSLEDQFYLLWPPALALMLRARISRRTILAVVAAGVVASAVTRVILYRLHRVRHLTGGEELYDLFRIYMGLDTRADALLVGCFLGLLFAWGLLPRSRNFRLASGAVALVGVIHLAPLIHHGFLNSPKLYHGKFTLVAAVVAVLIAHLLAGGRWAAAVLGFGPLAWVGRISYSLYLFHITAIVWLQKVWDPWSLRAPKYVVVPLVLGLMIAAAALVHYGVERPFLRLKGRLGGDAKEQPAPATSAAAPPRLAA